jgi:DNA-directed RNA polymerase specialized sigma24 family protein
MSEWNRLYITEGKTQKELSDMTGISLTNVRTRLKRHGLRKNKGYKC